jgi:hypothetical protein
MTTHSNGAEGTRLEQMKRQQAMRESRINRRGSR